MNNLRNYYILIHKCCQEKKKLWNIAIVIHKMVKNGM